MNTPVKFELAKLLKEKGFEGVKSSIWYYKDGTLHNTPTKGYKGLKCWNTWDATQGIRWDAPTIAEVVMWLYEKHGIWIAVNSTITDKWYFELFNLREKRNAEFETPEKYFNSPTEAYEAAIEYTLKNLI